MSKSHTEVSKFLSYILRHQPESVGLTLDHEGWADINALIAGAEKKRISLDRQLIQSVVTSSDKKRFALSADGLRIRAVQGHSSRQVDIDFIAAAPPEFLFHGTATRFIDTIREQGLIPGARQYVHLSDNASTATEVGKRYGKPVVLKVNALLMHQNNIAFYQAENGVWLTAAVPARFIASWDHPGVGA
ncbi:RNA 2'-phosphotransferase [Klebsiella oxytoca]|uniref:RNA 2'-phosphotransferase n=1 Tax=Klebsiella oxytoca TaxID=571 RepID=UPI000D010E85|nr:RNA 2'-phosphotransferase [Klebsiella oxytoca]AVL82464.1 RNA 2'-phosphotransferase [Klebsiella oxytoca]EKX5082000.1 RNA 2'-phosphotransferase [Klebsiella oxytoca]EKX5094014.1 RNA 2'-phosphotransferase [Klebsiella oxytoca]ELQ8985301.1 RNA 2'-phosphotransferase [Klebsiella oxytoca]NDR44705.1 RNA 2'-phosphotransferase [Klebsiella oxytoca]